MCWYQPPAHWSKPFPWLLPDIWQNQNYFFSFGKDIFWNTKNMFSDATHQSLVQEVRVDTVRQFATLSKILVELPGRSWKILSSAAFAKAWVTLQAVNICESEQKEATLPLSFALRNKMKQLQGNRVFKMLLKKKFPFKICQVSGTKECTNLV